MQQLDTVFHIYCAVCAVIKIIGVVFASGTDDYCVANFVRYILLLAFHGLRLRLRTSPAEIVGPNAPPASAMSLLRWETVFFLGDEVYHMSRAASDLGVLLDACFYGIPSMAAMVRVMSSLFMFVFHTLFLGPRSSLASDAAIFFGDMQVSLLPHAAVHVEARALLVDGAEEASAHRRLLLDLLHLPHRHRVVRVDHTLRECSDFGTNGSRGVHIVYRA
ncbi:hypothetical protein MRX96_055909 [Rhipicephalus microplus]